MGTPSAARRDARRNFWPGYAPAGYQYKDAYYRKCFDEEWEKLQKEHDEKQREPQGSEEGEGPPTLEERVALLEEQVRQIREAGGL